AHAAAKGRAALHVVPRLADDEVGDAVARQVADTSHRPAQSVAIALLLREEDAAVAAEEGEAIASRATDQDFTPSVAVDVGGAADRQAELFIGGAERRPEQRTRTSAVDDRHSVERRRHQAMGRADDVVGASVQVDVAESADREAEV